jgi:LysR family transcriptional regulator, regulator of abg operon
LLLINNGYRHFPMPASIKLHQLRAFVEVSRQGSIRAASRTSRLSQPALTKSIQELEQVLGAKLFIRRSQGVVLTDCGDNFFQHASLILEELRVAQEDIQQRAGVGGWFGEYRRRRQHCAHRHAAGYHSVSS